MMCAIRTSLATTARYGLALEVMSLLGNPFDGHTLEEQLEQVERLAGVMPKRYHVCRDYKGHSVDSETCQVIIAGGKKWISVSIKQEMKRSSFIDPEIGHQRFDAKLGRNWLNSMLRGAQNAFLSADWHNPRKVLAHLRQILPLSGLGSWPRTSRCCAHASKAGVG